LEDGNPCRVCQGLKNGGQGILFRVEYLCLGKAHNIFIYCNITILFSKQKAGSVYSGLFKSEPGSFPYLVRIIELGIGFGKIYNTFDHANCPGSHQDKTPDDNTGGGNSDN
jgi:hypothetical protein